MLESVLVANRGRDRPAGSSPPASGSASGRWRCTPRPTPGCAARPGSGRGGADRPGRRPRELPGRGRDAGGRPAHRGPARSTRATGSWPRTRRSPAGSPRPAWSGSARPPAAIEAMGDKIAARNPMAAAGVPVAPGTEPVADADAAAAAAARIGYPVMVKAAAGGGGIGMSAADDPSRAAGRRSRPRGPGPSGSSAARRSCSSGTSPRARHVEVQILGLADGRVLALGERDCSVQRRHQKVAEETPSPGVTPRPAGARCSRPPTGRRGGRLPRRRHRRVPGRRPTGRRVRLPGDEHPAAGRAPGDRAGHRHRPGRAAAADRGRVTGPRARRWTRPARPARARDRAAGLRRGPAAVPAQPGDDHRAGRSRPARASGSTPATRPATRSRRSTTRCWPSCASGARTGRPRWTGPARRWRRSRSTGPKTNLPFFAELLRRAGFVSGSYDTSVIGRLRP